MISKIFAQLSAAQQAIAAITTAGVVGAAVGMSSIGFMAVPKQVAKNTADIAEHVAIPAHFNVLERIAAGDSVVAARLDRLLCLQTLPDSVGHLDALRSCP